MKTRRIIITVIVVAVLVGGFFVGRNILANRASEFLLGELQTEKAKHVYAGNSGSH